MAAVSAFPRNLHMAPQRWRADCMASTWESQWKTNRQPTDQLNSQTTQSTDRAMYLPIRWVIGKITNLGYDNMPLSCHVPQGSTFTTLLFSSSSLHNSQGVPCSHHAESAREGLRLVQSSAKSSGL